MQRNEGVPAALPFSEFQWTEHSQTRFWHAVSHSPLERLAFSRLNGEKLCGLLSHWITPGSRVLDFGAGGGHLTHALLSRGCHVAVIEPSQDLQSELWQSIRAHPSFLGFANPADGIVYDLVVACEVVEHILSDRYEQVFSQIVQNVRAGGYLIMTTPNNEDIEGAKRICPSCLQRFHPWQHVRSVNSQHLIAELSEYGFTREFLGFIDFSNNATTLSLGRVVENFLVASSYSNEDMNNPEQLAFSLRRLQNDIAGYFFSGWRPRNDRDENDLIDLRLGDEATCVFVGKKNSSNVELASL
jgi:2-polyprenyl-3-methyl-5-hydroxy-6-metoxy-1,4-benzoquinol methylase